jgi:hypothetical protein
MKKLLFFLLIFTISNNIFSQQNRNNDWYDGQLTLENNMIIQGLIQYDYQSDIVKIKTRDNIKSFTAKQCLIIEFFDEVRNQRREFFSLPYAIKESNYEVPIFFEVITFGEKITLLARQSIGTITERAMPGPGMGYGIYPPMGAMFTREVELEAFYVLKGKNKIRKLTDDSYLPYTNSKFKNINKKILSDVTRDRDSELKSYIKKNKLNIAKRNELIRIIEFYNTI